MASSTRQSALFGTNDWQAIYQTFKEADFKSYDYETLRKSFIDYLRLHYPETFNDYIESSEFIALLDVIAFMGQGLAFRNDLNTRENFIDTAERRDSVVKLANLVGYTPKRNLTGQGYLKVVSIKTTQNINDINGFNMSNLPVLWNDPANINWLEQYNTVVNAALVNSQRIGRPGNSQSILGVKTDEYSLVIPTTNLPVIPFSATVNGTNMNFELVSSTSINQAYVYELPPGPTSKFNLLYRNDKLGYGSPNTGFFFYFKQGSLQTYDFSLGQRISNQVIDINIQGVNDSDTWLYQIDSNTGIPAQWKQVENIYADAYLQSESNSRQIFSVLSRFNDQVSYSFGDGVFSEIPVGSFRSYVRTGNSQTYSIDPMEMQGISVSIPYISRTGNTETLTLGLELKLPVSNAQARETLASIKQRAPTRYYTQNRMVNGEDYNNFPYTLYSSIIKSKAINRSSVGVARNLDLLDPTGKYSSTNSFAADGALYQDTTLTNSLLTITNTGSIIKFLNDDLAFTLSRSRAVQHYLHNYARYDINSTTGDGVIYWQGKTVDANSLTGYMFKTVSTIDIPIPIGTYSSHNAKYITTGSMIKFSAPPGQYFNTDNRLVSGIRGPSDLPFIWTSVLNVNGDGYNNGLGAFTNGLGPVTLSEFVPTGAILTQVIPAFDNSLSTAVIQECVIRMELQQSFSLVFDNSLTIAEDRWAVSSYTDSKYFVRLQALGNNRYSITYRALAYYFASVADTRFSYESAKLVYDPSSGKQLQDYVSVLASNTRPGSNVPLVTDITMNVIGQNVESDGYINTFEAEVTSINVNNRSMITNPDFFNVITGYVDGAANKNIYAFFELVEDAIHLSRKQLIPTSTVDYLYETKTQIELVKYEYKEGQIFYATAENKFYKTVQDTTVTTPYFILTEQANYYMKPGRQGLRFQYRHNSNNTARIDPATTNIIDLYIVTQPYYTAYRNWIQDTTNTVAQPDMPTINELNQAYSNINNYKMMSDSVILNSVVFKPLFGSKAAPALQATIKVIKTQGTNASDSEIRSATLAAMNSYFDINNWGFGDVFYFSELSAYLHTTLASLVNSVVLVPNDPTMSFGDMYEIRSTPYEIFVNAATAADITVITSLTSAQLQIR
jgi:hypothetical protein